jgi:hypothetical protein
MTIGSRRVSVLAPQEAKSKTTTVSKAVRAAFATKITLSPLAKATSENTTPFRHLPVRGQAIEAATCLQVA